ncbi:hypothetical protein KP509_07G085100 [Ceratopteris richardii]|uniref:Uncharacterized protein n=1 Tax=Ceratopteris richardii TaxID=49495 RepID=A0A8T2UK85_CERRI|nr:hypothetical protein KP509_07G085100 [Ceratopteris richardii]
MASQGARTQTAQHVSQTCVFSFLSLLLLFILALYWISCHAWLLHSESPSEQLLRNHAQKSGDRHVIVGKERVLEAIPQLQTVEIMGEAQSILRRTVASRIESQIPGSKPPPCHNQCPECYSGVCIAHPFFLRGSGGVVQHAVWSCRCVT